MKLSDLDILRCPRCAGSLEVWEGTASSGVLKEGILVCFACRGRFPIEKSIARFASTEGESSYDITFAHYGSIQLDSVNGTDIARKRFDQLMPSYRCSPDLKKVLQVGCGSGRYTEVGLASNVDLWSVDLSSSAVEACHRNLGLTSGLHLLQADIYHLPFPPDFFDIIYSLGVLMAVPSPLEALRSLHRRLKPGGLLVTDVYRWRLHQWLDLRLWLRPITSRLPAEWLWKACNFAVPLLWPASRSLGRIPKLGRYLRYLVPICNYEGILPLDEGKQKEYSLTDTFDMLAATFSHHATERQFRGWLQTAGFSEVEIIPTGMMTAKARKPAELLAAVIHSSESFA